MQDLTIIIPTYNRYTQFKQCINSAFNTIGNTCKYIIGDSNAIKYDYIDKFNMHNIKYLNLHMYQRNLVKIYQTLLEHVDTKYVLILEDDDFLLNEALFNYINEIKDNYDVITFGASDIFNRTYLLREYNNSFTPKFWNGEYQFGMTIFNTKMLIDAFNIWFSDKSNNFVYSSDEAIMLIALYKTDRFIHINNIGLKIGIGHDNLSWNNIALSLYSSYNYIDKLAKILNFSDKEIQQYKQIQLHELQTMCKKLTYELVYDNLFLKKIHNAVLTKIENNTSYDKIYEYINNTIHKYLQLKHII